VHTVRSATQQEVSDERPNDRADMPLTSRDVVLALCLAGLSSCGSPPVLEEAPLFFAVVLETPDAASPEESFGGLVVAERAPSGVAGVAQVTDDVDGPAPSDTDETSGGGGSEGSNPLGGGSNVDIIWNYLRGKHGVDTYDQYLKGSTMIYPRLKLTVEAHYVRTNSTGSNERAWDFLSVKPIWFVRDVEIDETWGMRVAAGFEYIKDFDHRDKGIGAGTDLLAPLLGLAFMNRESKTVLIPLVQHFEDVGGGPNVQETAFRVIALQPLDDGYWLKGDLRVPRNWENNTWPAFVEAELGKMVSERIGVFVQTQAGIGGDRPFDWGGSLATRVLF
jgi:hypothetical protein